MTSPWAGSVPICAFAVLPHNPILAIERSPLSPIKLYYKSVDQRFGSPHFWVCSWPIKHSQLCQLLFTPRGKMETRCIFLGSRVIPTPQDPQEHGCWVLSFFLSCRNIQGKQTFNNSCLLPTRKERSWEIVSWSYYPCFLEQWDLFSLPGNFCPSQFHLP